VKRYDWPAIRRYYEAGHTLREAQERYGFSNGAWASAVARGDVTPRPGRPPGANGVTRETVLQLLREGHTKSAVAAELGITKSSVSRHAALAGLSIDERCARRYDWDAVQAFYDEGRTIGECVERFGFSRATFNAARARGAIRTRPRSAPRDVIFVQGVRRNRGHLKQRLRQAGLLPDACEECGLSEWRGKPLTLQLHHLNGDGLDNRIENLVLLCANCHSQTENWGGRNVQRKAA
jgi:DNA-binding transcriptional ArsR family regulator